MIPERLSVMHSWCVQADWDAPTIVGGEGAWFWDEDGRRYLDMSSLAECMTLGHQHPALIRAIREQAEELCFVTAAWGAEPRSSPWTYSRGRDLRPASFTGSPSSAFREVCFLLTVFTSGQDSECTQYERMLAERTGSGKRRDAPGRIRVTGSRALARDPPPGPRGSRSRPST
jgi:hypothetical protein